MRRYFPTFNTEVVRALILAAANPSSPAFKKALTAARQDLQRIDQEEAEEMARQAETQIRLHPSLTTQKVLAILRKEKFTISSADSRFGASEGLAVSYGDYERTWVKVSYAFTWNFGYSHSVSGSAERKAMVELVEVKLFTDARLALSLASLEVSAHNNPKSNPHLSYLRVKPC